MKKHLIILGLLGFLITACTSGSPKVSLDQMIINLGQVINGEIRTMEIPVQNSGTSELLIEAVTTSCGCTTAEVDPLSIAPGETGLLKISFDSGAHGPDENGPVMRQVFIASNDPNQAEIEFRFTADVVPDDS